MEIATSALQAHAAYVRFSSDLGVLDVAHGRENTSALTQDIRARAGLPIIVLSVRTAEHDKVAALKAGADDVLTKPEWDRTNCSPALAWRCVTLLRLSAD